MRFFKPSNLAFTCCISVCKISDSIFTKTCPALTIAPSLTLTETIVPVTALSNFCVAPFGSIRPIAFPVSSTLVNIAQGKIIAAKLTSKYNIERVQTFGKASNNSSVP